MKEIVALYCDGGVIGRNPSTIGGTYAWCGVDAEGNRVIEHGGVVEAIDSRPVTNNWTEQIAIVRALESMPEGWSGTVYSDSQIALGRVFKGWKTNNLPRNIIERSEAAVKRLGTIRHVLLQGHPTKADLACGIGKKRGYPVSEHNVWADRECNRQAEVHKIRNLKWTTNSKQRGSSMNHTDLGILIKQKRQRDRLSILQASTQSGVHKSTLRRIEMGIGASVEGHNLTRILSWIGYVPEGAIQARITEPLPDVVSDILASDPALSSDSAARLTMLFRNAYEAMTA